MAKLEPLNDATKNRLEREFHIQVAGMSSQEREEYLHIATDLYFAGLMKKRREEERSHRWGQEALYL